MQTIIITLWLIVLAYVGLVYYRKVRLHVRYLQLLEAWEKRQPKSETETEDTTGDEAADPWQNAHELFGDPSLTMPAWLLMIHYETDEPELENLRKRINSMTVQIYIVLFSLMLYMSLVVLGIL